MPGYFRLISGGYSEGYLRVLSSGPFSENSLMLDGVDEYVNANTVVTDASTNTGTWLAWFNPSVKGLPSNTGGIISCGNSAANTYIWLAHSSANGLAAACVNNGIVRWNVGADVNPFASDGWRLVGITHDGVEAQMYVDGVAIPQTFTGISDKTLWIGDLTIDQFSFGARRRNGVVDQYTEGKIDEVQLYNTALSASDILDIYNGGCPKDESNRSSLYSYYRMGDGTGDNWNVDTANEWTFVDQVGSNDVTGVNTEFADVVNSAPCVIPYSEKSLLLDGVDEYVNADSLVASVAGATQGTWSAWIKTPDATPTSNKDIITFGDTNGSYYLRFTFIGSTNKLTFGFANVTEQWRLDLDDDLLDNVWYHIAIVQNGVTPVMYVNGIAVGQAFVTSVDTTQWFNDVSAQIDNGRIGCLNFNSGGNVNFFNGNIDEITIWNVAKSASDVSDIYNGGCPKDESTEYGLVAYYRMGDADDDNWNVDTASEWTFINQQYPSIISDFNQKSLLLDGSNEYINADSLVSSLASTTKGTWVAWFKPVDATPVSANRLIGFGDTNANEFINCLMNTSGGFNARLAKAGATQWNITTDSAVFADNTWAMIALVQDGTSIVLNVNGTEYSPSEANATIDISVDTTSWFNDVIGIDNGRIGCLNWNSAGNLGFSNGNFDEIQFYNTNLSTAALLNIYNNGTPKDESARSGLVSYYRMGDGTSDNWNVDNANEWTFIDQVGSNDVFTANCEEGDVATITANQNDIYTANAEQFDVVTEAPCTPRYTAKSLLIDGLAEYVNINSLALDTQTDTVGTISFWWRPKATIPASSESILAFSDTNADTALSVFHLQTTGKVRTNVRVAGVKDWEFDTDTNPFVADTWYHVAFVHDGVEPKIYIDGVAVAQTFTVSTDKTFWLNDFAGAIDNATIGCRNYNSGGAANFANANVVNFMYVRRALTEAQVQDVWNGGCPKDESLISNGVSYYRMGNAAGDNFNTVVANEWEFVDQIGTNNAQTVDCELDSVETVSPC